MAEIEQVTIERISKRFGHTQALQGISAVFSSGKITLLSGANGSGKSTLLNIIALKMRPSSGRVLLGGEVANSERADWYSQVGWLGHEGMLYGMLSGHENLSLSAKLFRVDQADRRIGQLCEELRIGAWLQRQVSTYSKGQAQRVSLARALLHKPKVLLLDEPASGLDSEGVQILKQMMQEQRQLGTIVVVSTHREDLVEQQHCQRITLEQGKVRNA